MLQYIVPPIIVVVSLAILVYFISRKAKIIGSEIEKARLSDPEQKKNPIVVKAKGLSLSFLEKMTRRSKLMSLRFHNFSDKLTHAIRKKRESHEAENKKGRFFNRIKQEAVSEEEIKVTPIAIPDLVITPIREAKQSDKRAVAPMVSRKVVRPTVKKKVKNRMEEALIERIAMNPKDIEAYERLGDYYLEQKNYQDSLECFKQVLKLSPINYKAKVRVEELQRIMEK